MSLHRAVMLASVACFLACALLDLAGGHEAGLYPALSAHKTNRLDKADLRNLKWNAGIVHSPEHGWVAVANHNVCYWEEECSEEDTPWVAFMGQGQAPEPRLFEEAGEVWAIDRDTFDSQLPGVSSGGTYFTEDYRVFHWKGSLYLNTAVHTFAYAVRPDQEYNYYPALLRMDIESKRVKLEYIFKERLDGSREPPEIEKNWGFFERDGRLLILYQTFPCTIVYEFDDRLHTLARLVSKKCYAELDSQIMHLTYLSLTYSHNSANPVVWERKGKRELLAVVHNRNTDTVSGYNHWLVRIDYETLAVTHLSHGIVAGSALSHAGGHLRNAILVGSVSIVEQHGTQFYYIYGGEGDTYSVYWAAPLHSIRWLSIIEVANEVQKHNATAAD